MKKDIFYIVAKDTSPKAVYDAVSLYVSTFDNIEDAIKYGLNYKYHVVLELTTYDDNIINDDDIKIVYPHKARL